MSAPFTTRAGLKIGLLYRPKPPGQLGPDEALLQAALLNTRPPASRLQRLLAAF